MCCKKSKQASRINDKSRSQTNVISQIRIFLHLARRKTSHAKARVFQIMKFIKICRTSQARIGFWRFEVFFSEIFCLPCDIHKFPRFVQFCATKLFAYRDKLQALVNRINNKHQRTPSVARPIIFVFFPFISINRLKPDSFASDTKRFCPILFNWVLSHGPGIMTPNCSQRKLSGNMRINANQRDYSDLSDFYRNISNPLDRRSRWQSLRSVDNANWIEFIRKLPICHLRSTQN